MLWWFRGGQADGLLKSRGVKGSSQADGLLKSSEKSSSHLTVLKGS